MDLIQRGKEQAERFGAQFQHGSIEAADLDGQPLELSLSTRVTLRTRALVVATLVSHPDGCPAEKYETGAGFKTAEVDVGGVFYAIGHEPNTDFLQDTPVDLDDSGYAQTSAAGDAWATTATAADGVFAAGDVMDREYQQAVTAAGMGSMAALDAEEWLESAEAASADSTGPIPTEADD